VPVCGGHDVGVFAVGNFAHVTFRTELFKITDELGTI
jgi:hypothetical protein